MPYSPRPASHEFATGYLDTKEWSARRSAAHTSRSDVFTGGLETERSELISRKEAMRHSAERISLNKRVSGAEIYMEAFQATGETSHKHKHIIWLYSPHD